MLPVTTETWCIICYAVRPPRLSHPSAVKDICGELLSSTDKAAVMSEAQSPWGRWLMRIIGGTPTATPQPPAYPHTPSPTGPLHFTSSYSPVDSHYGTISTVIGCMGLLLGKWIGGGLKNNNYNMEMRSSRVWVMKGVKAEQSSSCDIPHKQRSRPTSQQSLSLISIQETKSMPETF